MKARPRSEPFGQIGKDSVVVSRLTVGRDDGAHGNQKRIVGAAADVFALKCHCAGKNEVGVAGRRGPGEFMHDERVELGEGLAAAD